MSAESRVYEWCVDGTTYELRLVRVLGTDGTPFLFGADPDRRSIAVREFHMASTPVTQALWTHVMGSNPAVRPDLRAPVENVSWDDITRAGGFLEQLNASAIRSVLSVPKRQLMFRLPSESEWEYAARGGPHWTDGLTFSGSDNADAVAWYGRRFSRIRRVGVKLLGRRVGWRLFSRGNLHRPSRTHAVATKMPNQLGLYDMSGNVWEWCQDRCTNDIDAAPPDGTPWLGAGTGRRLRGGCHHNWDIHCTVWFRYGIAQDFRDGCIGFRFVLA